MGLRQATVNGAMRRKVAFFLLCLGAFVASRAGSAGSADATAWKTYETCIGASQYVALTDESSAQLNTSTKLRTHITGTYRAVTLERGEAFFHVVRSPLDVIAGDLRIGARDSSFSVRAYGGGNVDVIVLDGSVRIDPAPDEPSGSLPSARQGGRAVSAGQIAAVRAEKVSLHTVGRTTIGRKLMWRYGMLEFVNETIDAIAAEFNRYSRTRVIVDDSIGNLRVGGRFSAFDPDTFVATASRIFELRIETRETASGVVVRLARMSTAAGVKPR
jgi:transmembrane sensor